jgi:hypothetical protein
MVISLLQVWLLHDRIAGQFTKFTSGVPVWAEPVVVMLLVFLAGSTALVQLILMSFAVNQRTIIVGIDCLARYNLGPVQAAAARF